MIIPAHGPLPDDPAAALANAHRRAQRLVDDPQGAVWYAARRIFGYALMIRDGIALDDVHGYLLARSWLTDAADQLDRPADGIADELVATMRRSGAITESGGRLYAAAEHARVDPGALDQPWPRDWPAAG